MRQDRVQVVVLFAMCIAVVWLLGPPLRSWEILVVGTGAGLGVGAIIGMVLVGAGRVKAGGAWGDGSLFRVAQGVGVALLAYGLIRPANGLITLGAVLFAVGSIIEIRHARVKRST
jgi:O-antigen/teichoic acid export membrane protein